MSVFSKMQQRTIAFGGRIEIVQDRRADQQAGRGNTIVRVNGVSESRRDAGAMVSTVSATMVRVQVAEAHGR